MAPHTLGLKVHNHKMDIACSHVLTLSKQRSIAVVNVLISSTVSIFLTVK